MGNPYTTVDESDRHRVEKLQQENERLREKNRELHRRAQQAEAAAPKWQELLEIVKQNKQGVTSFSRLLLSSGLQQAKEENDQLQQERDRLAGELCDLHEKRAQLGRENERLREGVSAFVSDLCLRAEEAQRQNDHEKAGELWAIAEKWEELLPKNERDR